MIFRCPWPGRSVRSPGPRCIPRGTKKELHPACAHTHSSPGNVHNVEGPYAWPRKLSCTCKKRRPRLAAHTNACLGSTTMRSNHVSSKAGAPHRIGILHNNTTQMHDITAKINNTNARHCSDSKRPPCLSDARYPGGVDKTVAQRQRRTGHAANISLTCPMPGDSRHGVPHARQADCTLSTSPAP